MRYLVGVVKRHPASRRVIQRMPAAARVPVLLVGLVLWAGLLLSTAAHVTPVAYADTSKPSVTIVFPAPASNGVATGPVGTNVTIQAAGLSATDKYVLGYATQSPGCAGGFQATTDTPFGINADGTYSTTFSWPATAKDIGASYVVCMQDSSQATNPPPPIQSGQTFVVAGASAPAVNLKHVSQPTPGPGTPTPVPQPNTRFYSDEQIVVSGTSFYTSGANVAVYLTSQPIKVKTDLVNALQQVSGTGSFSPDANGAFTATVQLPGATDPGTYYLYAVSADGSDSAPPSLAAFKKISIVERPTPVPTATAKAHSTATGGTGNNNTGGGGIHIQNPTAVLGLGALSIILFVVGVILLASAAGTPRANR
jgi:hypothetical protein